MKDMAAQYINGLIAQGEHQQQDFKYEISDVCKIAKTLSAFANTDGGRLLIGVKDNGKIAGVHSEEEQYMIQAAAEMYCTPPVGYAMTTYNVEGRNVLVAEIEPSASRPVKARDSDGKLVAYVRVADENFAATAVHIKMWEQMGSDDDDRHQVINTERAQRLITAMKGRDSLSINQCCRLSGLRRPTVIGLLARFVRYDIVGMQFDGQKFAFSLKE